MSRIVMTPEGLHQGRTVRANVERCIRDAVGERPRRVALLLSSGLDSTIVGLGAAALGHRVHAYTFRLAGHDSIDSRHAEATAHRMGWEWTPVDLPTDVGSLVADWPLMYELGCRRKPDFECCWPFLYVYPRVRERFVLNGLHADAHFGLNRKSMKAGATTDKAVFDEMRRGYFEPYLREGVACLLSHRMSGATQHVRLQRHFGLTDVNPFLERAMHRHLLRFSWQQLNRPRQKHFFAAAYPDEIRIVGWRNHVNYQLAAGGRIDTHFQAVLGTPVNFRGRRRTIDMFGDWRRYSEEAEVAVRGIRDSLGRDLPTLRDLRETHGATV